MIPFFCGWRKGRESAPVIENHFANLDCRKAFLLLEDGIIKIC